MADRTTAHISLLNTDWAHAQAIQEQTGWTLPQVTAWAYKTAWAAASGDREYAKLCCKAFDLSRELHDHLAGKTHKT
jgi:hypothetical protein